YHTGKSPYPDFEPKLFPHFPEDGIGHIFAVADPSRRYPVDAGRVIIAPGHDDLSVRPYDTEYYFAPPVMPDEVPHPVEIPWSRVSHGHIPYHAFRAKPPAQIPEFCLIEHIHRFISP